MSSRIPDFFSRSPSTLEWTLLFLMTAFCVMLSVVLGMVKVKGYPSKDKSDDNAVDGMLGAMIGISGIASMIFILSVIRLARAGSKLLDVSG